MCSCVFVWCLHACVYTRGDLSVWRKLPRGVMPPKFHVCRRKTHFSFLTLISSLLHLKFKILQEKKEFKGLFLQKAVWELSFKLLWSRLSWVQDNNPIKNPGANNSSCCIPFSFKSEQPLLSRLFFLITHFNSWLRVALSMKLTHPGESHCINTRVSGCCLKLL